MAVKQYRASQKFSTMKRIRMETCKHFSLRVRVVYSDKIFVKDDAVKFQCGKRNFRSYFFSFFFFSNILKLSRYSI